MSTSAAKELIEMGERIEQEIVYDVVYAVEGLPRYEPTETEFCGETEITMTSNSRGDYLDRSEVMAAIRRIQGAI